MVDVYRPQGVVFIGIDNNWSSSEAQVISYCQLFDWDFPVGQDTNLGSTIFVAYGTDRHNYMVIGKDGRISHRAANRYTGAAWSTYETPLKNAIAAALAVPVAPTTWSRVKSLLD